MRLRLALVLCAAVWVPARAADSAAQTATEVRAADTAFAQDAATHGLAQAFRDYMDPLDGLSFGGPKPLRGADAIYRAMGGDKPAKFRLEWVVTNAWGSRGGDMGVTVGDWRRTKIGDAQPSLTGRYVTVWRRDAKGAWKGRIDIGEEDEKPQKNAANP
jgi:ketosteroid isomerase-like protein